MREAGAWSPGSAGPGWCWGRDLDRAVDGTAALISPAGNWRAVIDLIPTYADGDGEPLRLTLRIDGKAYPLSIARNTGDAAWAQAVLDNRISIEVPGGIAGGNHRIELLAESGGVLIEAVRFVPANDRSNSHR